MQLELGGGVEVGGLETEICGAGVGVGVVIWLGILGMTVGDGRITLWLNESPAIELDDEVRGDIWPPHAASKTIKERHDSPQQIFFTSSVLSCFTVFMTYRVAYRFCTHTLTCFNLVLIGREAVKICLWAR